MKGPPTIIISALLIGRNHNNNNKNVNTFVTIQLTKHHLSNRLMGTKRVYCLLIVLAWVALTEASVKIAFNQYRRNYERAVLNKLTYGHANDFSFGRFQSSEAIDRAMSNCRSASSFRYYSTKEGKDGYYCSTRLGGDWVLAESKQIAKNCHPSEVLSAYLDVACQKKWNADKVKDITITRTGPGLYRQEMILKPQRVLTGKTTEMRYTQLIRVDKISDSYNAFVELDLNAKSNTKLRPFDILSVNVSLQQVGEDVHIYAAGLMRVNRSIVPNLIVFDASGIAGALAGKGTLWLSSHFANRLFAERKR